MLAKHSFGQANGAAWQYQVPSHDAAIADRISALARWHEREQESFRSDGSLTYSADVEGLDPELFDNMRKRSSRLSFGPSCCGG